MQDTYLASGGNLIKGKMFKSNSRSVVKLKTILDLKEYLKELGQMRSEALEDFFAVDIKK